MEQNGCRCRGCVRWRMEEVPARLAALAAAEAHETLLLSGIADTADMWRACYQTLAARCAAAEAARDQLRDALERLHRALAQLNDHHTQVHHAGELPPPFDPVVADGFLAYRFPDGRLRWGMSREEQHG
jgi:hypothetical protein